MAAKKFLRLIDNIISEVLGIQVSLGAPSAGEIVALGDDGRIDQSMMPTGIGADVAVIEASETLSAGDLVNVWQNGADALVRKADASIAGKEAHGFVLQAVSGGNNATVYFEGTNTQVSGLTPGPQFLLTTAGLSGSAAPNGPGNVVQRVGVATSPTALNFEAGLHVRLAS